MKSFKPIVFNGPTGAVEEPPAKPGNSADDKLVSTARAAISAELAPVRAAVQDSENRANARFDEIKTAQSALDEKISQIDNRVSMISVGQPNAQEDPKRGYASHREFLRDVMAYHTSLARGKNEMPKKLLNAVGSDEARISSNPDGGFLVPPGFLEGILSTNGQGSQTNTGAFTTQLPMESHSVEINARVDKTHTTSVSGGLRVYRPGETGHITASNMKFEQLNLKANELAGLAFASGQMLSASPSTFVALVQNSFGDEFISRLNHERLRGTGTGEYLGIFSSDAAITVAKESGQTADTIVGKNLVKMRARCWGYQNAVWMANPDCLEQLISAHVSGTNGDRFLFALPEGMDVQGTLLGRPVLLDENMSTIGDLGDIALVNWKEYIEGAVGGLEYAESIHVRFDYNEKAFRFLMYNAGMPWWTSALTPKHGATLSPIVMLAARA